MGVCESSRKVIKRERGNKRNFVLVKRFYPRGSAKETGYRSAVLEYSSESKEEDRETYSKLVIIYPSLAAALLPRAVSSTAGTAGLGAEGLL